MAFAGFGRGRKNSISNGDWDRDGVINRKDCEPLNFRKQDPEHRYKIKKVGKNYMIYDSEVGSFLIGYTFDTSEEAKEFTEVLA